MRLARGPDDVRHGERSLALAVWAVNIPGVLSMARSLLWRSNQGKEKQRVPSPIDSINTCKRQNLMLARAVSPLHVCANT
jgi:hypothetical protein